MLKAKPFNEFESLILRKHDQKIPFFKEDIEKQSYITEHRHLYLLFELIRGKYISSLM
jgi:hypothetical protein